MGRLRLAHILCSDVGYNETFKTGTYIFSVVMWAIMGRLDWRIHILCSDVGYNGSSKTSYTHFIFI